MKKYLFSIYMLALVSCLSQVNAVQEEADYTISAEELVKEFESNEAVAKEKYMNRTIETIGQISNLEKLDDGIYQLLLVTGTEGYIQCNMKPGQNQLIAQLAFNEPVKIKGICKGKLENLVFESCNIIK